MSGIVADPRCFILTPSRRETSQTLLRELRWALDRARGVRRGHSRPPIIRRLGPLIHYDYYYYSSCLLLLLLLLLLSVPRIQWVRLMGVIEGLHENELIPDISELSLVELAVHEAVHDATGLDCLIGRPRIMGRQVQRSRATIPKEKLESMYPPFRAQEVLRPYLVCGEALISITRCIVLENLKGSLVGKCV